MANAAIAYRNLADDGTVSASTAEPAMPVSRLQNEHVGKRWRSTAEPGYVILDLGSSMSIDTIALLGMTAAAGASCQVRASASDATVTGSLSFDSGSLSDGGAYFDTDYGALVYIRSSPVSTRYVRIDITDTPASYVEAGRLFVGLREAFTYNFAPGAGVTWADRSRKTISAGGQTLIFPDNKVRSVDLNFEWVTAAQREGLIESIDRINGQSIDVLMILDTDSDSLPRDTIFGLISAPAPNLYSPIADIFSRAYRIEERK